MTEGYNADFWLMPYNSAPKTIFKLNEDTSNTLDAGQQTLSDIGSTTTIMVRAYFRLQASADVRESIELELWDAMVEVDTKLRSDANLDGNCTDSTVGSATVSTIDMGGGLYRAATISFEIQLYEEITITP